MTPIQTDALVLLACLAAVGAVCVGVLIFKGGMWLVGWADRKHQARIAREAAKKANRKAKMIRLAEPSLN